MMVNSTHFLPAALPPDGVVANFENKQDGYTQVVLATAIVCAIVVNAFFIIHAYVKLVVKSARLYLEDWFCIAAWFFVNTFIALNLGMSHYGLGRKVWEVTREGYKSFLKLLYISTAFYTPAAFCTKVTLLLLIARVFSVHPTVATGIRIFIVLIFLAYVPIAFLKIFVCKPITAYWDDYDTDSGGMADGQNGNCRGQATLFMGDIMISVITDVLILLLPIPLAWRMEAPRWQKIKIVFLLGAGGAATVTTVFRAWLNVQFMHTNNVTLDFGLSCVTSMLELGIGLLCACLPSANLLFGKWMGPKRSRGACGSSPQGCHDEKTTRRGRETSTDATTSSYWSSLKSMILTPTLRTFASPTVYDGTRMGSSSRHRRRRSSDAEMGSSDGGMDTVIFNNRLDMPSIGSTTDERSRRSSRELDHRGGGVGEEAEADACVLRAAADMACSASDGESGDDPKPRKDSVMEYDSFMSNT